MASQSSSDDNTPSPTKDENTIPTIQPKRNTDPNVLAPFNPTNALTQSTALELFALDATDTAPSNSSHVLFDLGCGDARVLIQAVQDFPHVRCVGLELDPVFVQRACDRIATLPAHVQDRIDIRQADLTDASLWESRQDSNNSSGNDDDGRSPLPINQLTLMDDATCIYIYLLPQGIVQLLPFLRRLVQHRGQKPLKVIACTFRIREWEPSIVVNTGKSGVIKTYLYEFGRSGSSDEHSLKNNYS